MKNKQRREWKKTGRTSEHHLRPRSRGGESVMSNLFHMDVRKHEAWHLIFSNLTLEEIIALLQRVKKIKEKQQYYEKR